MDRKGIKVKNDLMGFRKKREWIDYCKLIKSRPEEFAYSPFLKIETDEAVVMEYMKKTGTQVGVVYKSKYHLLVVDLVFDKIGEYYTYERLLPAKPGDAGVVMIPILNKKFILIEQYRHALRSKQYSFPRGFSEKGITNEDNVRKELKEELNATISKIVYLGKVVADSGVSGKEVSVYACDIEHFKASIGHEGILNSVLLSKEDLENWIVEEKIDDGFTLAAYSLFNVRHI